MQAILWPIISWIFREIVVKFVLFSALFALLAVVVPYALNVLTPFIGGQSLTSAFTVLSPGVWFWLDFFALDFGLPLMISAYVARFLIRRLPMIG